MSRPVLLIEIGAGPLPAVTPVSRPRGSWVPVVYQAPPINPPAGVIPTPVNDGVLLQWEPVAGVDVVYIIDRSATAEGPWLEIDRTTATRYLYSDGTNSVWYFRIRASINGRSGDGSVVRAQLDMTTEKIRQEFLNAAAEAEQLTKQLTDLAGELAGQAQELANLQGLIDAPEWTSDVTWNKGALVKRSGRLYVAEQNVPVGIAITDLAYWNDIGQYATLAEAVGAVSVATNQLNTEVALINGELDQLATALTGVRTTLAGKADASALTALTTRVTNAENALTSTSTAITYLDTTLNGKASASSVQALTTRVTTAENNIIAISQSITSINSVLNGKADANALQALQTTVNQQGNAITAQSTALTSVQARTNANTNMLVNPTWSQGGLGWSIPQGMGVGYEPRFGYYLNNQGVSGGIACSQDCPAPVGMYTYSVEVFRNNAAGTARIELSYLNAQGQPVGGTSVASVPATTGQWQRVVGTAPQAAGMTTIRVRNICEGTNSSVSFRRCKLESGSVATIYTDENSIPTQVSATQSLTARLTTAENGVASYLGIV
ncbi:hypothetical protein [Xanthomonas cucurbitae]|uniref:DUF1983 domain-containing protein n=1 Tax=Xanthomonas cucurbitae TaxID=56453 RepID=A0ABY7YA97_9XANT|nr:hypothetical protein [Xanthomonas cucurbitae]WDM66855.1 hypothetical protein K6981_15300 [Xanthomonas cucurbitae]WDM70732.1 hypothetical protein K6978_15270 [Xanthomonas cucurbitae]